MKKTIITLLAGVTLASSLFTSCRDMLTVDSGDKTYENAQDTLYSYLGVLRALQDVAERQVILGEIRGDLVSNTNYTTDTLNAISRFENPADCSEDSRNCSMLRVSDYYNVINNCNFYIYNCDTSRIRSNIKFMIPEYTQVKAIRAWTYLQLVKNYGEVPYITEPIINLDVINDFDYDGNLVNKDNLIDKFIEEGLPDCVSIRYPQYGNRDNTYGSWNNGSSDISAHQCFIPIRLVLADTYLLRGNDKSDFSAAARYYYDFLRNETTPLRRQYCYANRNRVSNTISYGSFNNWGSWGTEYSYSESTNEVVSLIPSSSNAGLGKMLTRVADIFGYTPSSQQQAGGSTSKDDNGNSSSVVDANGNQQYESFGSISVTPTYKRQYCPSLAWDEVTMQQTYVIASTTKSSNLSYKDFDFTYIDSVDSRKGFAVQSYTYEGDEYPLCSKAARNSTFYYAIPIYRKSLIWLRLAEAINRMGYPEFAFAILKDGLNKYSIPKVVDHFSYPRHKEDGYDVLTNKTGDRAYYDDATTTYYEKDENGTYVVLDSRPSGYTFLKDTIRTDSIDYGTALKMYYLTDTVQLANFNRTLNFQDDVWNETYGIHAKGCGFGGWALTSDDEIFTNICGVMDTTYYDYGKLLLKQGVNTKTAAKEAIINAVENIIVDELALETAFEGNRFTDLVRIAHHKNSSGFNGTDWLAKKISSRDKQSAPLYSKLQDSRNWYLSLPAWK